MWSSKACMRLNKFMSWLINGNQGGHISSLYVSNTHYGRGLFASHPICAGERLLEVSQGLIITPSDLPDDMNAHLPPTVTPWTKLALFLVTEKKKRQASHWAPYISLLPDANELHNTFLWKNEELALLEGTSAYQRSLERIQTMDQQFCILQETLHISHGLSFEDFKGAYATVFSRALAIGDGPTLVLIPMLDICNHSHEASVALSYDVLGEFAVITADKDYSPGDQIYISYGDLSNAELALDYGFTIPDNPFDEVSINPFDEVTIRSSRYIEQVDFLSKTMTVEDREKALLVRDTQESLSKLTTLARLVRQEQGDGSLANKVNEKIRRHNTTLKEISKVHPYRKAIVEDLLIGELRVLGNVIKILSES